jgi:hypothetical protein
MGSYGSIALELDDRPRLEAQLVEGLTPYVGGGGAGVLGQWAQQLMLKR